MFATHKPIFGHINRYENGLQILEQVCYSDFFYKFAFMGPGTH